MVDNKFDREVKGKRSGKLDNVSLRKIFVNSNRVFKKKQERRNKNYNIILLIDESGSMTENCGRKDQVRYLYDSRIDLCAQLCSLLVGGLQKNNINFAIIGFDDSARVHKYFDKKFKKIKNPESLRDRILQSYIDYGGHNTYLSPGLTMATRFFKEVGEGHQILFILTDGKADDIRSCRRILPKLEKKGIDIIGVGIEGDAIKDYCNNIIIVNDIQEFMTSVLHKMQEVIKRG